MYEKITSKCCHVRDKNYDNPQCEGEKEFEDDLKDLSISKDFLEDIMKQVS